MNILLPVKTVLNCVNIELTSLDQQKVKIENEVNLIITQKHSESLAGLHDFLLESINESVELVNKNRELIRRKSGFFGLGKMKLTDIKDATEDWKKNKFTVESGKITEAMAEYFAKIKEDYHDWGSDQYYKCSPPKRLVSNHDDIIIKILKLREYAVILDGIDPEKSINLDHTDLCLIYGTDYEIK